MPGVYLLVLAASAAGVIVLDLRLKLALPVAPVRTLAAVGIGTAIFLAWDAVGIVTGVFVKGAGALLIGLDVAPQLPIEEPVFLAFLCYLGLVTWGGAARLLAQAAERRTTAARRVDVDSREAR